MRKDPAQKDLVIARMSDRIQAITRQRDAAVAILRQLCKADRQWDLWIAQNDARALLATIEATPQRNERGGE